VHRARRVLRSGIVAGLGWLVAVVAGAQERPVIWTVSPVSQPIVRGAVVSIHLTARINDGWHLYSISQGPGGPTRTVINVAPDQPFTLADTVTGPAVIKRFDPNFGMSVETYDREATFTVPVRVSADARPGTATVNITARFQSCNATLCMPPHTDHLAVPISIATAAAHSAKVGA
jgi:DsbC/DsbD-like thiol-disulfide interchange protein